MFSYLLFALQTKKGASINWLSHILLSKNDIQYQLGNLLADPLKGKAWEGAKTSFVEGVEMHKAIDAFTDSHPVVLKSKSYLGETGLLRGVVLDVLYDYFLSNHWEAFCRVPREVFIEDFHQKAIIAIHDFPREMQKVVTQTIRSKYLYGYRELEGVASSLRRIEKRLSPRMKARENLQDYFAMAVENLSSLEAEYLQFFPDLVRFFQSHPLGEAKESFFHFDQN